MITIHLPTYYNLCTLNLAKKLTNGQVSRVLILCNVHYAQICAPYWSTFLQNCCHRPLD
ncbi:hypothetical protein BMETH_934_1 [methanotrophic bacterial endosymbiont of Bathymodiolus sp.]|nr:hypothetical protein BMETH_934_1 [methanotrophic bacterial endosymbiont of Bathymodiolus sp.]